MDIKYQNWCISGNMVYLVASYTQIEVLFRERKSQKGEPSARFFMVATGGDLQIRVEYGMFDLIMDTA